MQRCLEEVLLFVSESPGTSSIARSSQNHGAWTPTFRSGGALGAEKYFNSTKANHEVMF